MTPRPSLLGTTLYLLLAAAATAQTPKPEAAQKQAQAAAPAREADRAAIQANDDAFVKAFNAGDAAGVAATFTEDGEMVDEENVTEDGRAAIAARYAAYFTAAPGATITLKTDSLKFLGPDLAVARGRSGVLPSGETTPEVSRFTVIFAKRDGHWLQASCKDERDHQTPAAERLKQLEWLVGEWVSESTDSVATWSCDWTDGKSFLLLTFNIHMQGKPAMSGTQRIGWDPLTRQFKSWVFDSDGGHSEGLWSISADGWVVKAHGVRQDGSSASATQVITRMSKDTVRWTSVDRTVAGRVAANHDEFVMVHKPPKPR